jgi:outer membrane protein assembly factor BamA
MSFEADSTVRIYNQQTGALLSTTDGNIPTPESLNLGIAGTALVYDTSISAGLGPMRGQRYRIDGSTTIGSLSYTTALADYRKYFMPLRPVTFAVRLLHYGRYGGGAEDTRLQQLFIGDQSLVRGYDVGSFSAGECAGGASGTCPVFDRLVGSRVGIFNLEIRAPLFGPLGLLSQSFLPVEIGAFVDAGTAWTRDETPDWAGGDRASVSSYGGTARINLLGFAIGQVDFVHPNDRPQRDWLWQFGLTQSF